jgi:maltokinase
MISLDDVAELLPEHLARQRWYDHGAPPARVEIVDSEEWISGDPTLWWMLVDAHDDARLLGRYQLVVGARTKPEAHDFLQGKDAELIGRIVIGRTDDGAIADVAEIYDATIDSPLAIEVLHRIAPSQDASTVRALTVEQSNSSIVYDEKIIVKLFRRIHRGANPDVEAVDELLERGYRHVPTQHGVLARPDHDGEIQHLAVAREFLSGATDGWHLALTSLRILFAGHEDPATSGGDFGPDAGRLGAITAELHLALADAFGTSDPDVSSWVAGFRAQLDRVRAHVPAEGISAHYDRVAELRDVGPAIRIHGDLHLGQSLRADSGWYLIDFEGEPARPLAERVLPSSPLRDVAGMLRSFHYAAEVARWEGGHDEADSRDEASSWEARARESFLAGYFGAEGIDALLPDEPVRTHLLEAFELDKATYEVAYEVGFRPTWVPIPLGAINRLLASKAHP